MFGRGSSPNPTSVFASDLGTKGLQVGRARLDLGDRKISDWQTPTRRQMQHGRPDREGVQPATAAGSGAGRDAGCELRENQAPACVRERSKQQTALRGPKHPVPGARPGPCGVCLQGAQARSAQVLATRGKKSGDCLLYPVGWLGSRPPKKSSCSEGVSVSELLQDPSVGTKSLWGRKGTVYHKNA